MPNTLPPIVSDRDIVEYRRRILEALEPGTDFLPLMSFKLLPGMQARDVAACAEAGAIAGKYYPSGSTTNAADGPRSSEDVAEALSAMEELGLVLCIHGEDPGAPVLAREAAYLTQVEGIRKSWPRLRLVLEHLSSAESVDFVAKGGEGMAASITAHHLLFTIDDMLGGGMDPHLFCKPILKSAADRAALREAAFSGSDKFFFGSDSAPHPRKAKEGARIPGGIYSAPTAICALAELFESAERLDAFSAFVGGNGARFYGLSEPSSALILERRSWTVPEEIDGIVPMMAGRRLSWSIVEPSQREG